MAQNREKRSEEKKQDENFSSRPIFLFYPQSFFFAFE
jgi:hypothetical protein